MKVSVLANVLVVETEVPAQFGMIEIKDQEGNTEFAFGKGNGAITKSYFEGNCVVNGNIAYSRRVEDDFDVKKWTKANREQLYAAYCYESGAKIIAQFKQSEQDDIDEFIATLNGEAPVPVEADAQ